ncbi:hypothetical protein VNO77_19541 [Canavalia gladiata]|uniref:Uncharacterized protein n=1 Tax=Canavalia gladiata TaxID=3824 RepID=A0AAN9LMU3_CANGL
MPSEADMAPFDVSICLHAFAIAGCGSLHGVGSSRREGLLAGMIVDFDTMHAFHFRFALCIAVMEFLQKTSISLRHRTTLLHPEALTLSPLLIPISTNPVLAIDLEYTPTIPDHAPTVEAISPNGSLEVAVKFARREGDFWLTSDRCRRRQRTSAERNPATSGGAERSPEWRKKRSERDPLRPRLC